MKSGISLFLSMILLLAAAACTAELAADDSTEIEGLIKAQEDCWNRGDFEGFMDTYWKSEEMCFQSANSRLHGWETLLKRYKTNYAGEKRGHLTFTDLEITLLDGGYAYAIGRYNLKYPDDLKQGLFTLIFKKFEGEGGGGWKIIHDHSSS